MTKGSAISRDAEYLDRAERHAGGPFAFRDDLARMVSAAADPARREYFEEALFLAGFIRRARGILSRSGPDTDDLTNLTTELTAAIGRISVLIEKLNGGDPETLASVRSKFLALESTSFMNLQGLIGDLALLKNFEMDLG